MKTLLFVGGFSCLLSIMAWAFSMPPANFAGVWVRDNNKVEGMKAPLPDLTWIITQDDNQLSIEPVGSRKSTPKEIYKLDGSQTITEITDRHPRSTITRSAKWLNDGQILELTNMNVSGGDSVTKPTTLIVKDQLELAEGGDKLNVRRKVTIPPFTTEIKIAEIKFTFHKK